MKLKLSSYVARKDPQRYQEQFKNHNQRYILATLNGSDIEMTWQTLQWILHEDDC